MAKEPKIVDILGNTWSARHLARHLVGRPDLTLRLWNEGKPVSESAAAESPTKLTLVPDFLKDHLGLGFRTQVDQILIHHSRRRRDAWRDPVSTASALECGPEALALLHNLVFLNSYGARVLEGHRLLRNINYEWDKTYNNAKADELFSPPVAVFASKTSIERVWDNMLQHDGAHLNYTSSDRVESIRPPSSTDGLALILSAPSGVQDDTDHVVSTQVVPALDWRWRTFQCEISRELAASVPKFFVWIAPESGQDFLSTGLLYDGAVLRVYSVSVPHSDDKVLIQVDRLSLAQGATQPNPSEFFEGSPWYALQDIAWNELPSQPPDDFIYGSTGKTDDLYKRLTKAPLSRVGVSPSGIEHHSFAIDSLTRTHPKIPPCS